MAQTLTTLVLTSLSFISNPISTKISLSFTRPAALSNICGLSIKCTRVGGIEIPNNKRVEYSLQYIHGIGRTASRQVVETCLALQKPIHFVVMSECIHPFVVVIATLSHHSPTIGINLDNLFTKSKTLAQSIELQRCRLNFMVLLQCLSPNVMKRIDTLREIQACLNQGPRTLSIF